MGTETELREKRDLRVRLRVAVDDFVNEIQESDFTFALVLLFMIALNLADFAFTSRTLGLGYKELNPIMKFLFLVDPVAAGVFKMALVASLSALAWALRHHRQMVVATLFAVGVYLDLLVYHLVGSLLFNGNR